jgi:hypothetical protein
LKLTVLNFSHLDYDRLCVLVATAEASPEELARFNQHCDACPTCQQKLVEYGLIVTALLDNSAAQAHREPTPQEHGISSARYEHGRARLLGSLQDHILSSRPEARIPDRSRGLAHSRDLGRRSILVAAVAAAGLLLAVGVLQWRNAYKTAEHARRSPTVRAASRPEAPQTVIRPNQDIPTGKSLVVRQLEEELKLLTSNRKETSALLSTLKVERDTLLEELEDAKAKQGLAQQRADDLESAKRLAAGGLASAQTEIASLTEKLRYQAALLARQQRLLAVDAEIHNVLGASDLQVLDVQTVNVRGEVEQPFGRVFLAPRKALVMYAFDLNQRIGASPGDRFELWGNQGHSTTGGFRVGSLEIDQKEPKRWVLRCEDETILNRIETVYVTVVGKGPLPPVKPLLRAYLSADAGMVR